ncbi:DUF29 domain-containing protein [Nodosilinea sp. LEGE 06152]|uniref:DUF29 domain-containing protein n=1 Tax=Nodosilinea sp. LEGE 06152 TaxID=2777966 RepID=UPI001D144434
MTPARPAPALSLYEADYLGWLEATAAALKRQDHGAIDWEKWLKKIEDVGRRERQSLESNLVVLLLHLLNWQFQPDYRSGSWERSIFEHRRRIRRAIQASPSLKLHLDECLAECYEDAISGCQSDSVAQGYISS